MHLQNHSKVDSAFALVLSCLLFLRISFALNDEQELALAFVLLEVAPLVLLLVLLQQRVLLLLLVIWVEVVMVVN